MPENTNTNPIDLYFISKTKFTTLFDQTSSEKEFSKKINEIIIGWENFGNECPFIYCHQDDTFEVSGYDSVKINNCQFAFINDTFDGAIEIDKPFCFFVHSQTNETIIRTLKKNPNFMKNIIHSNEAKEINGKETPYYVIICDIFKHYLNLKKSHGKK